MEEVKTEAAALIASTYGIPESWALALLPVAASVGGSPFDLARVIWAESRFNPRAVNPRSGATGLIQFMPRTAKLLGTTTEAIYAMDFWQQLSLTGRYLQLVATGNWAGGAAGPLDNQYKMALAVFYPAWRYRTPDSVLPADAQAANPGIRTIGDYVSFVLGNAPRAGMPRRSASVPTRRVQPSGGGGGGVLVLGLLFFGGVAVMALSRATR